MKRLANLYTIDKSEYHPGQWDYRKDPDGYLFSRGKYRTKVRPEDLPAWYVYGRYYKQYGYLSAKAVKYLVFVPSKNSQRNAKDDCLLISYHLPIVPSPDRPGWYDGYDYLIYGSAIPPFLKAVEQYSDCALAQNQLQI